MYIISWVITVYGVHFNSWKCRKKIFRANNEKSLLFWWQKSIIHKRTEGILWRALGQDRIIPVLSLAASTSLALCFLYCLASPCSTSPSTSILLSCHGPHEDTFKIWDNREERALVQLSAHIRKHHCNSCTGYLCHGSDSLGGDQAENNVGGRW